MAHIEYNHNDCSTKANNNSISNDISDKNKYSKIRSFRCFFFNKPEISFLCLLQNMLFGLSDLFSAGY